MTPGSTPATHYTVECGDSQDGDTGPYRRLWAAVFRQGIADYRSAVSSGARAADGRVAWVYSNARHPGSFVWLCEVFGFSPEHARSTITRRG